VRIIFPELNISGRMTGRAKGNQIIKLISFPIIIKQMERFFMVDWQIIIITSKTAMLAGVIVPYPCCLSLLIPVFASVIRIAAKPRRVIFPRPIWGFTPFAKTSTTAKIMFTNSGRLFFKFNAAGKAFNNNSFSSFPDVVDFLPFTVTGKTTKMLVRLIGHIWFSFVRFTALLAGQCNWHITASYKFIIPQKWSVVYGSHFAA
jgi:hypothetical protein